MERDQPYLDMSGHPPNPNQSAPRSGQNILGAPYIAQPSSTGIQCLDTDTDTAPSLDPASIGLQDLQINQQSASGFSDAHMNVPYAGHPRPVGKGKGDKCVCFNCGVSIINWEANDDPLVEHYKLSKQQNKHCLFVIQEMAERQFNAVNNSGQTSPVEDQIKHHKRCGVCGARQIAVSQFSCGHIVCVRCAPVPGENRVCKMCGDKVVKTSAYDPAALDG